MKPEAVAVDVAAKILEMSERRVRELGKLGQLEEQHELNPATNRMQTVYPLADVERLRQQRQTKPAPGGLVLHSPSAVARIEAHEAQTSTAFKPWLTLGQAEELSGLPASVLPLRYAR